MYENVCNASSILLKKDFKKWKPKKPSIFSGRAKYDFPYSSVKLILGKIRISPVGPPSPTPSLRKTKKNLIYQHLILPKGM